MSIVRDVWVDTNVLVRLITGEPPPMAEAARRLAQAAEDGTVRLRLSPLVVAELVWVLTSFYDQPVARVAEVVSALVTAHGVVAEEGLQVLAALRDMATRNVDFADAFLAAKARLTGLPVCTFDTDFQRLGVETQTPG